MDNELAEKRKRWGMIDTTTGITGLRNAPGFVSRADEEMATAKSEEQGFFSAVGDAFMSGDNIAVQTIQALDRKFSAGPMDLNWKGDVVDNWIKSQGIDPADEWRYKATRNMQEASMLRAQQSSNEATQASLARRGGFSTFIAQGLAGIIDLDAPLALVSGGLSAGAKMGYNATKIGRLLSGVAGGAVVAGGLGQVSYAVNPAEDWTVIPSMMLMGGGFGAIGGAMRGAPDALMTKANEQLAETQTRFGEHVGAGTPTARQAQDAPLVDDVDPYGSKVRADAEDIVKPVDETARQPQAIDVEEVTPDQGLGGSSVGAGQVKPGKTIADIDREQSRIIVQNAKTRDTQLGLENTVDTTYASQSNAMQNILTGFQKLVERMPFTSDFNRFTRSQSAVARVLAYDIMESATGLLRNNDNAARYMKQYQTQGLHIIKDLPTVMQAWAKDVHGAGIISANIREDLRIDFNNQVRSEMNARFYGRVNPNVHPAIKQAADILDNFYEYAGKIEKGRAGQGSVHGMKDWVKKSGYVPQHWSSNNFRKLIDSGRKKADVVQAIFENYQRGYPKLKPSDLRIYAQAVVDRMELGSADSSTSIISWINSDGRAAVENFLARQTGISNVKAKQIIDGLTGSRATAGRAGYSKQRMDVDFDFTASNGVKISDLLENDMYGLAVRRAHSSAGRAALARKGLYSRADWDNVTQAILDEQETLVGKVQTTTPKTGNAQIDTAQIGADKIRDFLDNPMRLSRDDLDQMYKYFMGTPVYSGTSPWASVMKKVANLSLLGQLGMSSLAEYGVTMAAMGAKKFFKDLPAAVKEAIHDPGSGLYQDLRMLGTYTPDDRLHRFDQVYSTESMAGESAWFSKFNHLLNTAGRVQGFTSLFFHVQRAQHTMSVDAGVNKLFQHYNGSRLMSDERVRDMLGDHNSLGPKLQGYIKNGTVTFDKDGYVENLNLDKWDVDDVDAFARAINGYTHQLIQRPLIGESSLNYYKSDLHSLFWHLKSFPMLAMEKQFIRNARIGDGESMSIFLYSLATAALAYSVKNAVNLRGDNLDVEKIVDGAFKMNNIAGWLPMWTDPIGGMLGMGTDYGRSTSILSTPAALTTIDRLMHVPGVFFKDELDRSDVYALQALPIVGNTIGMTAIANTWKDTISSQKAAVRRKEKQEQPVASQEQVDAAVAEQLGLQ